MPEDASLDEFLSTTSATDEEGVSTEDEGNSESGDDGNDRSGEKVNSQSEDGSGTDETTDTSVEPAVSTSRSVPEGTDCPECGETATRLWRDGDRLVCAGCTSWDGG